jgi:CPA1 family monovalent cation:H+ antiporter
VLGGLVLGFVPGLPPVQLEPDVVSPFLLLPLLYPAALFTSWRDFRANLGPISMLTIGLVCLRGRAADAAPGSGNESHFAGGVSVSLRCFSPSCYLLHPP